MSRTIGDVSHEACERCAMDRGGPSSRTVALAGAQWGLKLRRAAEWCQVGNSSHISAFAYIFEDYHFYCGTDCDNFISPIHFSFVHCAQQSSAECGLPCALRYDECAAGRFLKFANFFTIQVFFCRFLAFSIQYPACREEWVKPFGCSLCRVFEKGEV